MMFPPLSLRFVRSMMRAAAAGMVAWWVTGCASRPPAKPVHRVIGQGAHEMERSIHRTAKLQYLVDLPKAYDADKSAKWPLVLFLHGAGERGTNLNLVAVHGPPKLVRQGRDFPFILVSPQCPPNSRWGDDDLVALLDQVQEQWRVDSKRIYVTGLSMGGYGAWAMGARHPDRIAAIAPVCGGGERMDFLRMDKARREALKRLGVWAFHGAKDNVVTLEESERMIFWMHQEGLQDLQLTVYPNADHDSWTEAYNTDALYEWLLAHRLP